MSPDKEDPVQPAKSDPPTTLRVIKKSHCVEGNLERRKRKTKLRSLREKQVLQVKDCDASLRLATDLPRFNWLELKLNQYGSNNIVVASQVTKVIKKDAKHKFLAQLSAQKTTSCTTQENQQIQQSLSSNGAADVKHEASTHRSCDTAPKEIQCISAKDSGETSTENRWPLKKRVMRTEAMLTVSLEDEFNKDIVKDVETTIAKQDVVKATYSESSPKPADISMEIKTTNCDPEEQPLDLSRLTKPTPVQREPVCAYPRLKVIAEAQIHLMQPKETQDLSRVTSTGPHYENLQLSRRADPIVPSSPSRSLHYRQVIQPVPIVSIHQHVPLDKASSPRILNSWGFTCNMCGKKAGFRCAECKKSAYCSVLCQAMDWSRHSILCRLTKLNGV